MPRPANDELVAVAFFRDAIGSFFATSLPTDTASWFATGFGVVTSVQPDASDIYSPVRTSILQVDTYGVNPNSIDPNWGLASDLAMDIANLNLVTEILHRRLTLRAEYNTAKVMDFSFMAGPRRDTSDPNGYAKYQSDVSLTWVDLGE